MCGGQGGDGFACIPGKADGDLCSRLNSVLNKEVIIPARQVGMSAESPNVFPAFPAVGQVPAHTHIGPAHSSGPTILQGNAQGVELQQSGSGFG